MMPVGIRIDLPYGMIVRWLTTLRVIFLLSMLQGVFGVVFDNIRRLGQWTTITGFVTILTGVVPAVTTNVGIATLILTRTLIGPSQRILHQMMTLTTTTSRILKDTPSLSIRI